MYEVVLGEDTLLFGMDDIYDYLKQYGHVLLTSDGKRLWLFPCVENNHLWHQQHDRLFCSPLDYKWSFWFYQAGTEEVLDKHFDSNLTEALAYYLENVNGRLAVGQNG